MQPERLGGSEIAKVLEGWPDEACDLALELRDFVLKTAPEVAEKVAFHSLCYYKPGQPYGVIGGNVCMIGMRGDCLTLSFIHGAFLPDPDKLLQGKGKASRHIEVGQQNDIKRQAFKKLIRAAVAHQPSAE